MTLGAQGTPPGPPILDPRGVLHGATFQSLTIPPFAGEGGGVAPGAIFRIYGEGLGPRELASDTQPYGLRLPDIPGGTEVHVRSIGTGKVAQASMLFVEENQLAAILPRNFPIGDAEVRVWYQGLASEPVTVPVVFSFPGVFTLAQNGVGRAVIQNVESDGALTLNGLTNSAKPGQYITLWATGLGDAQTEDVRVFFGTQFYPADFAGPAPGIPGLDQINVRLPEDLRDHGCYVRLVVAGDGLGSGPASIAISDVGGPCDHPWGLSAKRMAEIEAGDDATLITLSLIDQRETQTGSSVVSAQPYVFDEGLLEINASAHDRIGLAYQRPYCTTFSDRIDPIPPIPPGPSAPQPAPAQTLPSEGTLAGHPWVLTGPQGQSLQLQALASSGRTDLFATETREAGFLAPGEWSVRIPGGSAIGPVEFVAIMPEPPAVTLPQTLRRGEDLEFDWPAEQTGPSDEAGVSLVFRRAIPGAPGSFQQDGFMCESEPGANRIRIPLSSLSPSLDGASVGELSFTFRHRQTPPGLDAVDRIEVNASVVRS